MVNKIKKQIDTVNQKIKELNSLYHEAAIRSGISSSEISIWSAVLCSEKEYSQQDISEQLFLSKQTVNTIILNLEKKGFMFLEHVPGTRNRKIIRLTEEGLAYGKNKVIWIFQAEQKAMKEIEVQKIQACISMLEKCISNLKKEIDERNVTKSV